jgi:hypothetical protein
MVDDSFLLDLQLELLLDFLKVDALAIADHSLLGLRLVL